MQNAPTEDSIKAHAPLFISVGAASLLPLEFLLDPYAENLPSRIHNCIIAAFDRIIRGLDHDDDDPAINLISRRLIEARDSMPPQKWQRFQENFERECYQ